MLSTGYEGGQALPRGFPDLGWNSPAGQMYSNAPDLIEVVNALIKLYHGDATALTLNPSTVRSWLNTIAYQNRDQTGFGLPWEISRTRNYTLFTKGGSLPGFRSHISIIPELKLGTTLLFNTGTSSADWTDKALDILLPALTEWLSSVQPMPSLPASPERYTGTYRNGDLVAKVSVETKTDVLMLKVQSGGAVYQAWLKPPTVDVPPNFFQIFSPIETYSCMTSELLALNNQWVEFDMRNDFARALTIPGFFYAPLERESSAN